MCCALRVCGGLWECVVVLCWYVCVVVIDVCALCLCWSGCLCCVLVCMYVFVVFLLGVWLLVAGVVLRVAWRSGCVCVFSVFVVLWAVLLFHNILCGLYVECIVELCCVVLVPC